MDVQCVICKDTIDVLNTKSSGGSDVSALPCGHVFHTTCINKWFDQSGSVKQGTCPQCRCNVVKSKTTKLYLDLIPMENYENDPAVMKGVNGCLKREVEELELKLKSNRVNVDKMAKVNSGLRERILELEQKLQLSEANDRILSITRVKLNTKTKECENALDELGKLRTKLASLRASNTILNGNMKDAEDELNAVESLDKHDMALLVYTYKKDSQTLLKKHGELLTELSKRQEECRALRKKMVKYEEENSILNRIVEVYKPKKQPSLSTPSTSQQTSELPPSSADNTDNTIIDLSVSPVPSSSSGTTQTPDDHTPDKYALVKRKSFKIVSNSIRVAPRVGSISSLSHNPSPLVIPESYDGYGGHSRIDNFKSRFNKPFKTVGNRSLSANIKRPRLH